MSLYPAYFLAYVLFPAMLIAGIRPNDNRTIMDRDFTGAMKGYLVVYVLIHHFSQRMEMQGAMRPFTCVGYICVAFFFFASGYGLTMGYLKRKSLSHFLRNRFMRIYLPFVIANLITAFLYFLLSETKYSIADTLLTSITLRTIYRHEILWYLAAQLIFYLLFYISFRLPNKQWQKMLSLTILILCYIVVCYRMNAGFWWYNTALCFPVGSAVALYKTQIETLLSQHFAVTALLLSSVAVITWHLAYQQIWEKPATYIAAVSFAMALCVISYRVTFKTQNIFYRTGIVSYEFYIMNLPSINLINEQKLPISVSLFTAILLAYLCACVIHGANKAVTDHILNVN